jgi:cytidylate kinase
MDHLPRTVDQLVEEQARRWREQQALGLGEPRRPVVTVSRQHGARGGDLARVLAERLGLRVFDREILQEVAQSAHIGEHVVQGLDDRDRAGLEDWLTSLLAHEYISLSSYREHLTRVIGLIGWFGGAVILGRGAHLILGPHQALRLLVVAPLEERVAEVMRREGLDERQAHRRITDVEAERGAFLARHFHARFGDPSAFDLVVNTAALGLEGAVEPVRAALARRAFEPSTDHGWSRLPGRIPAAVSRG